MVPHLYPKTPGIQKSTQNLKITVIFGFWVNADIWIMVPHLYTKTPGTQKSTQNLKIKVIFGQGKLKTKNGPEIWTHGKLLPKAYI